MNKTKFQRILCVIVSCVLAFSVLTLPVSANVTEIPENFDYFLSNFRSYYEDYKSGNLSWGEFAEKTLAETRKLGYNNISAINGYKDLIALLESLGVDVADFWTDFYYQRSGGSSDDSILNGYGAVGVKYNKSDGSLYCTYYGSYGVICSGSNERYSELIDGYSRYASGYSESWSGRKLFSYVDTDTEHYNIFYYGDWRYEDDTPADDLTTEIPDKDVPPYDDDSIPEDDLIDFLEDLLDKLSLQFPDLSTVEGLLAALLSKLDTLDHDDDAAGLAAVQSAIAQLSATNSADSEKIISALNNMSSGGNFDFEKLKITLNEWIGLNGDYSEISKFEIVKDKFNKKIGFVSSFADLCGKVIMAYTKTSPSVSFDISLYGESHTISFDWLEQFMPTFRIMLCAFIYISYAWHTFRKVPGYISGGGENQ